MRALDIVVRGRYAKRIDWRKGQRLGKDDRLITMKRPSDKDASRVTSARLWKSLPQTITVRQVRVHITRPGFRTQSLLLITTLLKAFAVISDLRYKASEAGTPNALPSIRSLRALLDPPPERCALFIGHDRFV